MSVKETTEFLNYVLTVLDFREPCIHQYQDIIGDEKELPTLVFDAEFYIGYERVGHGHEKVVIRAVNGERMVDILFEKVSVTIKDSLHGPEQKVHHKGDAEYSSAQSVLCKIKLIDSPLEIL